MIDNQTVCYSTQPMLFNPALAHELGLNRAVVIQQIHYWIVRNHIRQYNQFDDTTWVYSTLSEWQKRDFYFFSIATLGKIIRSLLDDGYLIAKRFKQITYYRLNYPALELAEERGKKPLQEIMSDNRQEVLTKARIRDSRRYCGDLDGSELKTTGYDWACSKTVWEGFGGF